MTARPFLLAGELVAEGERWEIRAPYDGRPVGEVAVAGREQVLAAIAAAERAAPEARALPAYQRAAVLQRMRDGLAARKDELARTLAAEAGKPIAAARHEVERLLFTVQDGVEEAKRIHGDLLPLDAAPAGAGRLGLVRRFPLAPIGAITPFNFPLNLSAHKLVPAIACGATIVLKPPPQDPVAVMMMAEVIAEAGYPKGAVSILPCPVEAAAPLIEDPRIRMISFTGSARVGWDIRRRAGSARLALELGGNAAMIVEPDADLDLAVRRAVSGGYFYAGQSCISVQRILVHRDRYQAFVAAFVPAVAALRSGDPLDEATDVGPMISEAAAARAEAWVNEAVAAGASLATGGGRKGALLPPAVLLDTTPTMKVNAEEVFAPVTTVRPYGSLDEALALLNDSPYGLQAGLFTRDVRTVMRAWEGADVGGLLVNEIPNWRVDQMPYGGVKDSGLGREGVRYAIQEMTEARLLVL